jgi:hypothetical protein
LTGSQKTRTPIWGLKAGDERRGALKFFNVLSKKFGLTELRGGSLVEAWWVIQHRSFNEEESDISSCGAERAVVSPELGPALTLGRQSGREKGSWCRPPVWWTRAMTFSLGASLPANK